MVKDNIQDKAPQQDGNLEQKLHERTIAVRRSSRTMKGGRVMSFSALVVVGDGDRRIGWALGKASAVANAVSKATNKARKNMFEISLRKQTIGYAISVQQDATTVFMKPAVPGTGVVASRTIKSIMATIGLQDLLSKTYGSTNPINVTAAVMKGLKSLKPISYFARKRGITLAELFQLPSTDNHQNHEQPQS